MTLGALAWRFHWSPKILSWIVVGFGIISLFGGVWYWDNQRREAVWKLTADQKEALRREINSRGVLENYPIWVHFIGGDKRAHDFAYDLFYAFREHGWDKIRIDLRNNPNPVNTKGLNIGVCPAHRYVSHIHESKLKDILENAGLRVSGRVEEYYLGQQGCSIGIVVGQPPSAYERYGLGIWQIPKP